MVTYNLYMYYRDFSVHADSAAYFIQQYIDRSRRLNHGVNIVQGTIGSAEIALQAADHGMARRLLSGSPPENLLADAQVPDKLVGQLFYNYHRLADMLGEEALAYRYLRSAYALGEAHWRESSKKDMQEFELARKKAEQETRVLAQALQLEGKNNTILLLVIAFLAIAAIGGIVLLGYRRNVAAQRRRVAALERETRWEKERSELKGQLRERNRISRELHDDLGASLTAIALAGEALKRKNPALLPDMQAITATANDVVDTLNEIVWSLNSRNDSLRGLAAYIRKFATGFLARAGIQATVQDDLPEADIAVGSTVRRAVYLAAKEAVHNIVKHSGARHAWLGFALAEGRLTVTIRDDGAGTDPAGQPPAGGGNGLHNMKKHMELIEGGFSYRQDGGFAVTLVTPPLPQAPLPHEP